MKIIYNIKNIINIMVILLAIGTTEAYANNDLGYDMPVVIENGEIFPLDSLKIPVVIRADYTKEQWRMIRYVKHTLPYARMIAADQEKTEKACANMSSKERKAYLKKQEEVFMEKYKPIFNRMSKRKGKILINLINREYDAYDVIKGYKGGFKATMWQGVASLFGLNLHSKFSQKDLNFVNSIIPKIDAKQL